MSEPTPQLPSALASDSITALVVLITELRIEVRQALDQIKAHETDIATLRADHGALDTRVTVLETRQSTDDRHESDRMSRKAVFWGAIAALAVVCGTVVAIIVAMHQGG